MPSYKKARQRIRSAVGRTRTEVEIEFISISMAASVEYGPWYSIRLEVSRWVFRAPNFIKHPGKLNVVAQVGSKAGQAMAWTMPLQYLMRHRCSCTMLHDAVILSG